MSFTCIFFLFKSTLAKKTFIFMKMLLAKPVHFSMVVGSCNPGQGQLLLTENGKKLGKDQVQGWNGEVLSFLGPHEKVIPETEQSD